MLICCRLRYTDAHKQQTPPCERGGSGWLRLGSDAELLSVCAG